MFRQQEMIDDLIITHKNKYIMKMETLIKKKGTKTVNGTDIAITYEYVDGKLPESIEAKIQRPNIVEGIQQNVTMMTIGYNAQTDVLTNQLHNGKLADADVVIAALEEIKSITNSFKK